MREITEIVVHHTATPQSTSVESIRRHHTAVRGWRDIGYHYLIQPDGFLRMGRPEEMIGAHIKGMNRNSIGIAVIGDFREVEPEQAANEQLSILLEDLMYRYPHAKLFTHGEIATTECPGEKLQELVQAWRI